jgi:lipoprotein signal peptidase
MAWILAIVTVPILSAVILFASLVLMIIFQMLLVLHPSLGRRMDRMFQEKFVDPLFG